jgi:hypothetical protein
MPSKERIHHAPAQHGARKSRSVCGGPPCSTNRFRDVKERSQLAIAKL